MALSPVQFTSVAVSGGDVWATGTVSGAAGAEPRVARLRGGAWTVTASPGATALPAVDSAGGTVVAVGTGAASGPPLALRLAVS
ncbi:hypothetical protein [Dactylosporangium darangshiense]|uniref:Uncharacterized protein n=1 Tax=Dactylosporangium darangshiense TaxID=579108 RepID=A0ABP8DJJ8_9ACTN